MEIPIPWNTAFMFRRGSVFQGLIACVSPACDAL